LNAALEGAGIPEKQRVRQMKQNLGLFLSAINAAIV
jgi:hypothetical protein